MRTPRRLVTMVSFGLLLAACAGDDGDTADPAGAESPDPAGEDASTESDDAATADDDGSTGGEADLAVASTDLGDVLVDAEGMTLYLFTNDSDGQSACYDDCAAAWPPLTVAGDPIAGDGLDAGLVGTAERDDGGTQVTYAGSPLYRWASDSEPGDVTGQGVGGVWFVVGPDGEAIMEAGDEPAGTAGTPAPDDY